MLQGNRKLAAIITGVLGIVGLAALSIQGVPAEIVLPGMGGVGTLCAGGAILASDN